MMLPMNIYSLVGGICLYFSGIYGLLAYIIGAIPTGFLIARYMGVSDLTQYGSGTIGATNLARTISGYLFFVVLFFDAGKAALLLYIVPQYVWSWCIVLLMLGNIHSIFVPRFGGGKGVATLLGITLVVCPQVIPYSAIVFGCALFVWRSVGIASSIALSTLGIGILFFVCDIKIILSFMIAIMYALYMHRAYLNQLVWKRA